MNRGKKVPVVPGRSWAEIGRIGDHLIKKIYPELLRVPGPFPLDYFLEFEMRNAVGFGYDVQDLQLHIEAKTDPCSKTVILSTQTYEDLIHGIPRARFTVAHEIGHVILHAEYLQSLVSEHKGVLQLHRGEIPAFRDPECQANALASSLLMPTKHVVRLIDEGIGVRQLTDLFNVSLEAAAYRVKNIQMFTK
jgi:hypothetical protein